MARNLPSSGEAMFLEDIVQRTDGERKRLDGKSVRVIGRLEAHDVHSCKAVLADQTSKTKLTVDTTLVEPFGAKMGSLFQFIGELTCIDKTVTLEARVVRCVDGMDIKLYKQALTVQRQYLASRK